MPIPLLILNIAVLFFTFFLVMSLNNRFRLLFLAGALMPILICIGVAFLAFGASSWGIKEYFMLLMRGVFILSVFSGGLLCYFISHQSLKK